MRNSTKNFIVVIVLLVAGFTGLYLGFLQPRAALFLDSEKILGEETPDVSDRDLKLEYDVYDIYFADYSNVTEKGDLQQLTLEILLEVYNPFVSSAMVLPKLDISVGYLDEPVGRIWTLQEYFLEPYTSESSHSAYLFKIYFS